MNFQAVLSTVSSGLPDGPGLPFRWRSGCTCMAGNSQAAMEPPPERPASLGSVVHELLPG